MKTVFLALGIILASTAMDLYSVEEVHKKNTLVIDPTMRALDYQQAYETASDQDDCGTIADLQGIWIGCMDVVS